MIFIACTTIVLLAFTSLVCAEYSGDFSPSEQDNMNGPFIFAQTPNGKTGLFPEKYRDYPGGVESFDVYSPPMTTLYSQVWWKPLDPISLPKNIVEKYAGSYSNSIFLNKTHF